MLTHKYAPIFFIFFCTLNSFGTVFLLPFSMQEYAQSMAELEQVKSKINISHVSLFQEDGSYWWYNKDGNFKNILENYFQSRQSIDLDITLQACCIGLFFGAAAGVYSKISGKEVKNSELLKWRPWLAAGTVLTQNYLCEPIPYYDLYLKKHTNYYRSSTWSTFYRILIAIVASEVSYQETKSLLDYFWKKTEEKSKTSDKL